jgi:hypothetical protein
MCRLETRHRPTTILRTETRAKPCLGCDDHGGHTIFGRGPLRKDLDLGLNAGKTYGVPMPLTSLTRDIVQTLIGHGYTDQDVATLLLLQAQASGIELQPENVEIGDGLSAEKS